MYLNYPETSKYRKRIKELEKLCEDIKTKVSIYGSPITGIIFIVECSKFKNCEWVITINDSLSKSVTDVLNEFKEEYDVLRLLDQI